MHYFKRAIKGKLICEQLDGFRHEIAWHRLDYYNPKLNINHPFAANPAVAPLFDGSKEEVKDWLEENNYKPYGNSGLLYEKATHEI